MTTERHGDDAYMTLVRRFRLRPLATDADHAAAVALAEELVDRFRRGDVAADDGAEDYLHVLSLLIGDYEVDRMTDPDAADDSGRLPSRVVLRRLMVNNGLNGRTLAGETGVAESTISNILTGKRRISRDVGTRLARRFGVDPAALIG